MNQWLDGVIIININGQAVIGGAAEHLPEDEERSEGKEDDLLGMCGHQQAIAVVALGYQVRQGARWRTATILSHLMRSSGQTDYPVWGTHSSGLVGAVQLIKETAGNIKHHTIRLG